MEQDLLEAFIFVNLSVPFRHRPFDAEVEVINRSQAIDHFGMTKLHQNNFQIHCIRYSLMIGCARVKWPTVANLKKYAICLQ